MTTPNKLHAPVAFRHVLKWNPEVSCLKRRRVTRVGLVLVPWSFTIAVWKFVYGVIERIRRVPTYEPFSKGLTGTVHGTASQPRLHSDGPIHFFPRLTFRQFMQFLKEWIQQLLDLLCGGSVKYCREREKALIPEEIYLNLFQLSLAHSMTTDEQRDAVGVKVMYCTKKDIYL